MLNSIAANIIAGLGLFFTGLKMVDTNLRQAAGRKLRTIVGVLTRRPLVAGAVGVATGALVQSSSGIAFMLVSLVSSGLTTVRRALPILVWANVGCCALIFATVLDLRLAILYLIGVAGAAYSFDRSRKSHAFGAVLGIGMLFYGIEMMKQGAEPLKSLPWFTSLLNGSGQSYFFAFAGAGAFSFITQSSTAVSILAIGLAQTGLLGPFPTMMAIYGANVGSTFARMALSSTLKGAGRQLTAYQDLFKIAGVALFVPLLYVEVLGRVPLVCRFIEWRIPVSEEVDDAQPQYRYDEALDEPATALDLIEKEQLRLARRLRRYSAALRTGPGSPERAEALLIDEPFAAVAARIDRFQHELVNHQLGPGETERLTKLQTRLSLTVYLADSMTTLTVVTAAVPPGGRLGDLVSTFVEALDFVLLTMIEAIESGDRSSLDLLKRITEDHGDLMEQVRQDYLAEERSIETADRAALLQVTSVFARVVWMTHRFARLIDASPVDGQVAERPAGTVGVLPGVVV